MTSSLMHAAQQGRQAAELAYWTKYANESPQALTEDALQMFENLTLDELAEMALLADKDRAA
jgi:hypothetical protein